MPYIDKARFEIITLWVPRGTKHKLRMEAAKMGYKGVSEYIRAVLGIGVGKCKERALSAQIEGNKGERQYDK